VFTERGRNADAVHPVARGVSVSRFINEAGRTHGGCRASHLNDKENERRTYVLSTVQGTARPRNIR
jgi:hypothetical protein